MSAFLPKSESATRAVRREVLRSREVVRRRDGISIEKAQPRDTAGPGHRGHRTDERERHEIHEPSLERAGDVQLQEMIETSPRQVLQRHRVGRMFGQTIQRQEGSSAEADEAHWQYDGVSVNDEQRPQREADVMGAGAGAGDGARAGTVSGIRSGSGGTPMVQRVRNVDARKSEIVNDVQGNSAGPGTMLGFGATVRGGDKDRTWETKVRWGALDAGSGEGTFMEAKPIGPDHPSGQRSGSSDDQSKARAQFLTALTNSTYIQGHMLNDNIGGPASRRNLSAIPGKPGNAAHDKVVEEQIKTAVEAGHWVYYRVDVEYADYPLKNLNPYLANSGIAGLAGYAKLPGNVPATRDDPIRVASKFQIASFTYRPDGTRASELNRVNILFPPKLNVAGHPNNKTTFGTQADGYDADIVEFPHRPAGEKAGPGGEAVAEPVPWLNPTFELQDTAAATAPGVDSARIADEVDRRILDLKRQSVDEEARTIRYPQWDGFVYNLTTTKALKARRPRASNYQAYIDDLDLESRWTTYRTHLIATHTARYAAEWAGVATRADRAPALATT